MTDYEALYKIALGTMYGAHCTTYTYPKPKKVYYADESGATVVIWMVLRPLFDRLKEIRIMPISVIALH